MSTTPHLSGAIFLKNIEVFREVVGSAVVDRAIAGLPDPIRATYEGAVPVAWIEVAHIDAIYSAIAREAGREFDPLYREVVVEGVSRTLRTIWKMLLRLTTDKALVSRTPQIYAKGHDTGRLVTRIVGPGQAEIDLLEWPDVPDLRLQGIANGITATLLVAGREDVALDWERTDQGAHFRARWKV